MSDHEKAERCVRFLLGLRLREVAEAMRKYGLCAEAIHEGWAKLHSYGLSTDDTAKPAGDPSSLEEIDAFEDEWFPISRAALSHHYPRIGQRFFHHLAQGRGLNAAVNVLRFVEGLDTLEDPEGPFGPDGPKARELLRQRGLTSTEVERLRSLILDGEESAETGRAQRSGQAQLEALWAWYLEWSAVARVAVKDKEQLRRLGFAYGATSARKKSKASAATKSSSLQVLSERAAGAQLVARESDGASRFIATTITTDRVRE